MAYIDGYLIPIPSDRREAYREKADQAAAIFKKHGATRIVECWGDDVPDGKLTDFKLSVKLEPGESVVFSWVEWPSKDVRESTKEAIFEEMRAVMGDEPMLFDGKRMIFGGFDVILDTGPSPS
ncbi:MAG: DUF1428 domain-containing protein [Rhizobiaceae bacterium]|nr:DUF1428 domain-containing protein [Rhizobiaceae bacterium]